MDVDLYWDAAPRDYQDIETRISYSMLPWDCYAPVGWSVLLGVQATSEYVYTYQQSLRTSL